MKTAITFFLSSLLLLASLARSHAAGTIFSAFGRTNVAKGSDLIILDVATGTGYVVRTIAISNLFAGLNDVTLIANYSYFSNSYVTNLWISGHLVNEALNASQFVVTDGLKVMSSTLNGAGLTNLTVTAAGLPGDSLTNSAAALTPDFSLDANGKTRYAWLTTNAAFSFLAATNVDPTKRLAQTTVTLITNSTATAMAISADSRFRTLGTWWVTNVSEVTWFQYGGYFSNAICLPLF